MNLAKALRLIPRPLADSRSQHSAEVLQEPVVIALTGSGGKTTALFQLAHALSAGLDSPKPAIKEQPVIVTATTHLHIDQVKLANSHWIAEKSSDLIDFEKDLHGVMLVTGPISGDRMRGVNQEICSLLHAICLSHTMPLLIEADGSRQRPLKAPGSLEPPIPGFVDTVIVVAGLSGLGKPLTDEFVHRPEIFSRLSDLSLGEIVTPQALLRVLTHPAGGMKNIPVRARQVVLLNQADFPELQSLGGKMAQTLLAAFDAVIVGSLQHAHFETFEPTAGIILAAGESSRFGQPKQLMEYHGHSFVRSVTETALASGLSPLVVVTGANAQAVEAALHDMPITITRNADWKKGQSSSIQAGLRALSPALLSQPERSQARGSREGAVIFLLADQPQVTPAVIRALIEQHTRDLSPIIVPLVTDRHANPVLFDRLTFPDLMALTGDVGGRGIFSKYQLAYLPWHDMGLLLDVDTPEDLQSLRNQA